MEFMGTLPTLIVVDLDYTCWPFWVDTHVSLPFSKSDGKIVDQRGRVIECYPETPQVLDWIHCNSIQLGIASRTAEINGAHQLVNLFDWDKYVSFMEIYPGSKKSHFRKIHSDSNIPYSDMIFFDDEPRNIRDLEELGVLSIVVENGLTMKVLKRGLQQFESRNSSKSQSN